MVAAVIMASVILVVPPREKINLGLVLQVGLHLVLEVQVAEAVDSALARTADALRKALRDKGVNIVSVDPWEQHGIRMVFPQPPTLSVVEEVVRMYIPSGVQQQSSTVWTA